MSSSVITDTGEVSNSDTCQADKGCIMLRDTGFFQCLPKASSNH